MRTRGKDLGSVGRSAMDAAKPRKYRLPLCLLVLLITIGLPAQAAEPLAPLSPGISDLQAAYEAGQPHVVNLTAKLTAWPDLTDSSLSHLKALVEKLRLQLWFAAGAADSSAQGRLSHDGQDWLDFSTGNIQGLPYLDLMAGQTLPATRYLGSENSPPWQMLLGQGPFVPKPQQGRDALLSLWDAAYPLLAPYEKAVQTGITIKNAGRSKSQLVYALKASEAQAVWDGLVAGHQEDIKLLADSLLPGEGARQLKDSLSSLTFTGTLTIKRFLDDAGVDLGLQITATLKTGEQTRRLTLFGGQSADGLYLSLKLPATRGNDTVEVQVSLSSKPGQWQGDWRSLVRTGKDSTTTTGKLALASKMQEDGEGLTGDLALTIRRSGSIRDTRNYAVTPNLVFAGGGVTGTLGFLEQAGKTVMRQLGLGISLVPQGGGQRAPARAGHPP